MRGILGNFHNLISGDASRGINKLDLFGAGTVGGAWGKYLRELYDHPTTEGTNFKMQAGALDDYLGRESNAAGEQFSMATNAGGFYDSGARLAGLQDINRSKMASYSSGLATILANLEHEKMTAAFPFLQMQQENWNSYYNQIAATQNEQNFRGAQLGQGISSAFGGGGGIGGGSYGAGGGGGGGYTGTYGAAMSYGTQFGAGTGGDSYP